MTTESAVTQVVLSVLIVLCHRELGAAVLLACLCLQRRRWRTIGLGIAIGQILLLIYTQGLLSAPPELRIAYALEHASDLWRIFWAHPFLHVVVSFGPFWVYVLTRKEVTPAAVVAFVAALVLSSGVYDFTRVFIIVSAPLLLEITREVVAEITHHGGISIGRYRVAVHALWPLMFIQAQIAGGKLLWAQGIDLVLGS